MLSGSAYFKVLHIAAALWCHLMRLLVGCETFHHIAVIDFLVRELLNNGLSTYFCSTSAYAAVAVDNRTARPGKQSVKLRVLRFHLRELRHLLVAFGVTIAELLLLEVLLQAVHFLKPRQMTKPETCNVTSAGWTLFEQYSLRASRQFSSISGIRFTRTARVRRTRRTLFAHASPSGFSSSYPDR